MDYVCKKHNWKGMGEVFNSNIVGRTKYLNYKDVAHMMIHEITGLMIETCHNNGMWIIKNTTACDDLYNRCADYLQHDPEGIAYIEDEKEKGRIYFAKI